MKLAFELATYNKLVPYGIMDRAIAWWTQSPFCHVELVFDGIRSGLSFSATKEQGVRFDHITDLADPKHWVLVPMKFSVAQEADAYKYAQTQLGQKYNSVGLMRFVLGPTRDPKHEEFCSQSVLDVLQHEGFYPGVPPERVDPGFLYTMVTRDPVQITTKADLGSL